MISCRIMSMSSPDVCKYYVCLGCAQCYIYQQLGPLDLLGHPSCTMLSCCTICVSATSHIFLDQQKCGTQIQGYPRIKLPFGNVFKTLVGSLCGGFMDIMAGFPIYFCLEISGNCWSRRSVRNMCRSKPLRLWCVPPWSLHLLLKLRPPEITKGFLHKDYQ